ncbi:MAG: M48 family metallopeptidase [Bacteroidota bacterium]
MLIIRKTMVLMSITLLAITSRAQFQTDYTPMQSRGTIPEEFVTSIKGRYQSALKKIDKKDKAKTKRDKKEFLLESNNQIDLVLKSGKVVFQDQVSTYLGKVADKLLAKEPSLRKQLKFYPIKYENANAYAYNEGFVFVQIGLIARCQNEAELAFILGHETAHYSKKHSINRHAEYKKAQRNEGTYNHSSNDEKLKSIREYSRENETEADEVGFDYMRKAGYNAYAAASSLNGLRYSVTPIFTTPFTHSLLEVGLYRIPSSYLIENEPKQKENAVEEDEKAKEEEENEDVLSTHPSLDSRIENILSDLKVSDTIGKPNYLVSKAEFEYVRELCHFELCRIYLINNELDMAFYHISTLLQKYPKNTYLKRMMAATLYRIAYATNHGQLSKKITLPAKAHDELKAPNYLLRKFQKEELNLLALRYAWYVHQTTPKNFDTEQIIDLSITEYTTAFARNVEDFADSTEFTFAVIESYYKPDTSSLGNSLVPEKKGKIKKGKIKKQAYWFDRSLSRFALSELKKDTEFATRYKTIAEANPKRKLRNSSESKEEEQTDEKKEDKTIKGSKKRLNLSNVKNLILIEPEYILNDQRKRIAIDHIANEESEIELRDMLKVCAKEADFNLELMAANNIQAKDSTRFNDYTVLKEWVSEYFDHTQSNAIATDFNRIKEISERYDTRYAALFVNVSTIQKVPGSTIALATIISVIYPILLPWLVTKFFPEKECAFVLVVLDMQENKMIHGNIVHFDTKDRKDLLKSQIYATLVTLKGKKNK